VSLTPATNLPQVLLTRLATLTPISTTPVVPVAKFAAGVVDIGVILNLFENLQISFQILEKFKMALNWGKMIHDNNLKQKIS
jgi:hypothetical protein